MTRNTMNRFAQNPQIHIGRSRFKRWHDHKTTFDAGSLVPLYLSEILPGDTVSMGVSSLVRMTTPIFPVMDNAYLDMYFFYVPTRILWEHWKELNGENRETAWTQEVEYSVPQVTAPAGGWKAGTIADYMGIPTNIEGLSISALPFRAYGLIYNEFFRNQNTSQPTEVEVDDADIVGSNAAGIDQAIKGGPPLKASKPYDYFTGCLPQPQKGQPVQLPLSSNAPVIAGDVHDVPTEPAKYKLTTGASPAGPWDGVAYRLQSDGTAVMVRESISGGEPFSNQKFAPVNLWADLSQVNAATINQLRQAFQVQKLLEKDARGGTRYREVLREHFGVISPDARQQIPEYLGGYRVPINVNQVVQTSSTTSDSPQGNVAAVSVTASSKSCFTKSFTEHGYLLGLGVVRYDQTYQQGLDRMWSRKTRFDYYWPVLANIGEQAVLAKEIYAQGTDADDTAFGYQEAWADYRYQPSRVSGLFRSNAPGSLDTWHYAQHYTSLPHLSEAWMQAGNAELKRTLAVQDEPDFIGDFYFRATFTRAMPVYSIPGLIDHH